MKFTQMKRRFGLNVATMILYESGQLPDEFLDSLTFEGASLLRQSANSLYPALAKAAWKKVAEKAVSFKDWSQVYCYAETGSRIEQTAQSKMLETASTFEDWLELDRGHFTESSLALEKMVETATTTAQWHEIFSRAIRTSSKIAKRAITEIVAQGNLSDDDLFLLMETDKKHTGQLFEPHVLQALVEKTGTLRELLNLHERARHDRPLRGIVFQKIRRMARSFDDWSHIHQMLSLEPKERKLAREKMREAAKTFKDLVQLYRISSGAMQRRCATRILERVKTKEEWNLILDPFEFDGPLTKLAIQKVARLVTPVTT
jgi:hypothetical protein